MHCAVTDFGFDWGSAKVKRLFKDEKQGWIVVGIETPKHDGNKMIQIYVTKTGKVRIYGPDGEWTSPHKEAN